MQAESGGLVGAGLGAQRPVPGRRAHQRVAGGHVRGDGGRGGGAARAQRSGHGEHIDFSMAEVMTIAANSYAEYIRALLGQPTDRGCHAHHRDAVGRADPRRLRRLLHQQPRAVPQLPVAHRASRPHRRRRVRQLTSTVRARWDEWNEIVHAWTTQHTTAEIVRMASELRIPVAPVHSGEQHPRLRPLRRPQRLRRRPRRARSRCRAGRGAWTTRTRRCRARRRASGEHTGPVEPHTPARRPIAGGDPDAAARGRARARPHRVVGGPDRGRRARRARRRRDPRRVGRAASTACARRARARGWTGRGGSAARTTCAPTSTSATSPSTSAPRPGSALLRRLIAESDAVLENFSPRVLGNFGLEWEQIRGAQPAVPARAHARVRAVGPVARQRRLRADDGAGDADWPGSPATATTSPASSTGRATRTPACTRRSR